MKKKLLVVVVLNLVLCAALPWVYRWGMARFLGPHIFTVPFDKTLEPDPHLFPEADTVVVGRFTFEVPAGGRTARIEAGPSEKLPSEAGRLYPSFRWLTWDSFSVMVMVDSGSDVSKIAEGLEKFLYAKWHPTHLVRKAAILTPSFRELARIKTPFMEGYGWEMMQEEPHRYHYELTDDGGMVTLMVWARHDSDALKGIENVVASIRPIEQKPER